jgi:hypothetical protein
MVIWSPVDSEGNMARASTAHVEPLKRWTADEMAMLRSMYLAGTDNGAIADALGRSLPSVVQRLSMVKRREKLFSS